MAAVLEKVGEAPKGWRLTAWPKCVGCAGEWVPLATGGSCGCGGGAAASACGRNCGCHWHVDLGCFCAAACGIAPCGIAACGITE